MLISSFPMLHNLGRTQQRHISKAYNLILEQEILDEFGFARIHSSRWRTLIGCRYAKTLQIMEKESIIEIDHFYIPEIRPKGFAVAVALDASGTAELVPTDGFLIQAQECLRSIKVAPDVTFDSASLKPQQIAVRDAFVMKWSSNSRPYPRRSRNGRLASILTATPKDVRRHLLIDGEKPAYVDMSCTQPWILGVESGDIRLLADIESDTFYEKLSGDRSKAKEYFGRVFLTGRDYPSHVIEKRKSKAEKDGKPFVMPSGPRFFNDRPMMKKREYCASEYETAWEWSVQKRLRGDGVARYLQQKEGDLVIDKILRQLLDGGITAATVHDCVVCKQNDVDRVKQLFDQESKAMFGRKCLIKVGDS